MITKPIVDTKGRPAGWEREIGINLWVRSLPDAVHGFLRWQVGEYVSETQYSPAYQRIVSQADGESCFIVEPPVELKEKKRSFRLLGAGETLRMALARA